MGLTAMSLKNPEFLRAAKLVNKIVQSSAVLKDIQHLFFNINLSIFLYIFFKDFTFGKEELS